LVSEFGFQPLIECLDIDERRALSKRLELSQNENRSLRAELLEVAEDGNTAEVVGLLVDFIDAAHDGACNGDALAPSFVVEERNDLSPLVLVILNQENIKFHLPTPPFEELL
jgi:hypothetical protein